jgi:head-tail adaptor
VAIATFLNGRGPDRLRGLQFLALSDAATVQRRTATSDAGGGATWAWADVVTVPCRIYPVTLRGRPAFVGGALDERSTHYVTLPAQTDVTTSDRVVIAGRGTYDVTMVPTRTSELTRPVEVMQT